MIDPFDTLNEAERLLSKLPQDLADRIVLIGGQALLLWAEHYLIDQLTGLQSESLSSDDLDLMGRRPEVIECARIWGGEYRIPEMDDHSPQSGIVFLNNKGTIEDSEAVDFLPTVYGLTPKEVHAHSDKMRFGENEVVVKVMSPPLCLKSRIENLNGLHYGEEKAQREILRITSATSIIYHWLIDFCNNTEDHRPVAKAVTYRMDNILLSPSSIKICAKYSIDLSCSFPLERLKSKYPPLVDEYLNRKLSEYESRLARRAKAINRLKQPVNN